MATEHKTLRTDVVLAGRGKGMRTAGALLVLAVLTLVTYANSIGNGFVWDDKGIIVNNTLLRDWSHLLDFFSLPDTVYAEDRAPYYRPLNRMTYLVEYHLFGLNPAGYHAVNVLCHTVNVLLVYLLALRLFSAASPALCAALLFAIHPVNAEAVNFISARNNLLAALFVLSSFLTYRHGRRVDSFWHSSLAALLFFLGLLSKETALVLILILIGSEFLLPPPVEPKRPAAWLVHLLPFLASLIVYFVLRSRALGGAGGEDLVVASGFGPRMLRNLYIIPRYALNMLFPTALSAVYRVPDAPWAIWWVWAVWLAILVGLAALFKRRTPVTLFGLLWIALQYLPISNVVRIPSAPMADRYLYPLLIGSCLIVAEQAHRRREAFSPKNIAVAAGVLIMLGFAGLTIRRNAVWRDAVTLFSSVVRTDPYSDYGYYNLGNAFKDRNDFARAQQAWEQTIALNPRYSRAYNQLGSLRFLHHQLDDAARYYRSAVETDPDNAEAHFNLAMTLERLGNSEQALEHFRLFLRRVPADRADLIPVVNRKVQELQIRLSR